MHYSDQNRQLKIDGTGLLHCFQAELAASKVEEYILPKVHSLRQQSANISVDLVHCALKVSQSMSFHTIIMIKSSFLIIGLVVAESQETAKQAELARGSPLTHKIGMRTSWISVFLKLSSIRPPGPCVS